MSLPDRVAAKIEIAEDGCWLWRGAISGGRYGHVRIDGRVVLAHRAVYELLVGPIPCGLHALHACDVPACVNPDHIFLGTHQDNMRDRQQKGRTVLPRQPHPHERARGERVNTAKLTRAKVEEIRRRHPCETQTSLAREFGVGQSTISKVVRGASWR